MHGQQQALIEVQRIRADQTNAYTGNDAGRQRVTEDAKKPKTI